MTKTLKDVVDRFSERLASGKKVKGPVDIYRSDYVTDLEFWQEEYRNAHKLGLEFAIQAEGAVKALSDALREVTSGDHVSRAYRAQMVIEEALAELACEQDG